jgi:arylamine N-acetyltransferase
MIAACAAEVAREFLAVAGVSPARPDLVFLTRLTRAFGRLPYENITKVLRAAQTADPFARLRTPEIVLEEHRAFGAGGTCFSLANFFEGILRSAGFAAHPVLCDRSYGPDTHCALIVAMDGGRYLVDPGYLMEEPMRVPTRGEVIQRGPQGALALARLGESRQLLLRSQRGGGAKIRYRLRDEPVPRDQFVARWIDSFGWAQMRHLCASRMSAEGQLFLRDGRLRRIDGVVEGQERVASGLAAAVERHFGIDHGLVARAEEVVRRRS